MGVKRAVVRLLPCENPGFDPVGKHIKRYLRCVNTNAVGGGYLKGSSHISCGTRGRPKRLGFSSRPTVTSHYLILFTSESENYFSVNNGEHPLGVSLTFSARGGKRPDCVFFPFFFLLLLLSTSSAAIAAAAAALFQPSHVRFPFAREKFRYFLVREISFSTRVNLCDPLTFSDTLLICVCATGDV